MFAALLIVSIAFGGLRPYREMRDEHQHEFDSGFVSGKSSFTFRKDESDPVAWLTNKINLEQKICGPLSDPKRRWLPRRKPKNLRDGLVAERAAANIVQGLFVVIAALLIVGIAVH